MDIYSEPLNEEQMIELRNMLQDYISDSLRTVSLENKPTCKIVICDIRPAGASSNVTVVSWKD